MASTYPRVEPPHKQGDGSYVVRVHASATKVTEYPAKDLKTAQQVFKLVSSVVDAAANNAKIGMVRGPTWDKSQKRWLLRWTEDGEQRSFTSVVRSAVAEKRIELVGEAVIEVPLLKHFATASDIRKGLEQVALALNRAAASRNSEGVLLLRKYAAGLSEIGSAIVPHSGYVELEEDHADLLEFVEALHNGKELDDAEKPTAIARPASTLKSSARPGKKPSRSRDPLSN